MLATQIEVSDGTLNIVNVGIEFFNQADISVSLNLSDPLVLGVDYQWNSATTIQFLNTVGTPSGLVPNGVEVLLRRHTQNESMYNVFDGGAPFSRLALDENYEQLLFLSQEFSEGLGIDGLRNNLDMNGFQVVNLGDPQDPGDATNKAYVDYLNMRALRTPEAVAELPNAAGRANKVLAFDASGNPIMSVPASGSAAALAIDLANAVDPAKGAALVGFIQDGIGAVGTDMRRKGKQTFSVFDFMTQAEINDVEAYTYGVDVTASLLKAVAAVVAATRADNVTSGAFTTSYTGTSPILQFPKGGYKITAELPFGSYFDVRASRAVLAQFTNTADIVNVEAYQLRIKGLQFVGGRHGLRFYNQNINSTMVKLEDCDFFLQRDYMIKSLSTHLTWTHLSTNFSAVKCRAIACNKIMDNCCDNAVFDTCWFQPDIQNLTASTAQFRNLGRSATDLDSQTRLHIRDSFLIPAVGVEGSGRPNNIRWIDNYGSFTATHSRFGGEFGGMSILWNYQMPNTAAPWNTTEVGFYKCQLFAGPDVRTDSCVIGIQGALPNRIVVKDCTGPVNRPIVANLSGLNIDTFMSNFETASGRKAYDWFKVDIEDVSHDIWAIAGRSMMPDALWKYTVRGRMTDVRRTTAQSLANGFVNNLVSFDVANPVFDNVGAYDQTTPTRILLPKGCSRMRITAFITLAVDGAAKTVSATIVDTGLTALGGDTSLRGINPSADVITIVADVVGVQGQYWSVNVRHNGAGALNLSSCRVTAVPLDYMG